MAHGFACMEGSCIDSTQCSCVLYVVRIVIEVYILITFKYQVPEAHEPYTAIRSLEVEIADEQSLDEMLDAYKSFLLATGYTINGDIVVEPYDTEV